MTWTTTRRTLLLTATLGAAALAIPGYAQSAAMLTATGFTHSVASGEPGPDTMLLWTRYVPDGGGAVKLRLEVAETADFALVIAGGETVTGPWRDFTAKVTVDGLRPGTRYHYRFVAPDGSFSPTGRTKTLPGAGARKFSAAIFSCSNFGFGYFNAYAHAAARDDIDLAIHLGDYIYEYTTGGYPAAKDLVDNRVPQPINELIALADYRLRYASYRADPDLAALHLAMPTIVSRDDHESANDTWEGGAENHQAGEGDWTTRKIAALQAWREWMPVGDEPWKEYDLGGLGSYYRTDTRQLARSRQPETASLFKSPDVGAAIKAFHDGAWRDPAQTMMGSEQEVWLAHAMRESVARRQRWQVVGVGAVMGTTLTPPDAVGWLSEGASERARTQISRGAQLARAGLPSNFDSWGGYPVARERLLAAAAKANADLIVISGDSHNGWAFDLANNGRAAGVEFGGHSVTSPGYESALTADPKLIAASLVRANSELKWCDTSRRGYMAMTLTPSEARNDWIFVDSVRARGVSASVGHSTKVRRGAKRMTA